MRPGFRRGDEVVSETNGTYGKVLDVGADGILHLRWRGEHAFELAADCRLVVRPGENMPTRAPLGGPR